ncbi:hypothetical protein [Phenylobacterium sp.]|jgi:hypothetical protein|uniref:hypothetical protein n=1 Tax=Phenylobacterium sp. TaxID=1871053 RepID=UPI002F41531D
MSTETPRFGSTVLSVSLKELDMIYCALNEVCYGGHIPRSEIHTRLGCPPEALLELMERVNALSEAVTKSSLP